jgi:hypothetical protein
MGEKTLESVELDHLYNFDCIAGMNTIPAGTVDLVFADPPFNIGYEYDVYEDRMKAEQYLDWSRQWGAAVVRALKPDGTFWLAIGDDFAAELKIMFQQLGLSCRSWVIWYYTFGVNCKRKFSRSHTHLFHFVKDPPTIAPTPAADCPMTPGSFARRMHPTVLHPKKMCGMCHASAAPSRNAPAGTAARCRRRCWNESSKPVATPAKP